VSQRTGDLLVSAGAAVAVVAYGWFVTHGDLVGLAIFAVGGALVGVGVLNTRLVWRRYEELRAERLGEDGGPADRRALSTRPLTLTATGAAIIVLGFIGAAAQLVLGPGPASPMELGTAPGTVAIAGVIVMSCGVAVLIAGLRSMRSPWARSRVALTWARLSYGESRERWIEAAIDAEAESRAAGRLGDADAESGSPREGDSAGPRVLTEADDVYDPFEDDPLGS
jgi:hypothetical protein